MATLIVANDGSFLVEKHDLEELGIKPSDQIKVELQPNGQATWKAEDRPLKRTLKWEEVAGTLRGVSPIRLTLAEISKSIEHGWAGRGDEQDR